MNRFTDLAEQEAAEAERDEPGEDQAEQEAEAEREADKATEAAPEPPSEAAVNAMQTKLDKEDERHEAAVAKILGDGMAAMSPCPLCLAHGFVPSEPMGDVNPDQRAMVLWVMGDPPPLELKQHGALYECPTCAGLGDLLTGSRKPETRSAMCPDCSGKGYRDRNYDAALSGVQGTPSPPLPAVTYPPPGDTTNGHHAAVITQGGHTFVIAPGGAPDPCGRLAGHPLWGAPAESGGL